MHSTLVGLVGGVLCSGCGCWTEICVTWQMWMSDQEMCHERNADFGRRVSGVMWRLQAVGCAPHHQLKNGSLTGLGFFFFLPHRDLKITKSLLD